MLNYIRSIIAGLLITVATFVSPVKHIVPTQAPKVVQAEAKKQALAKFYNNLITAEEKQDWATLYKIVPQSVRDNVTEAQFATFYSGRQAKENVVSRKTIVNSIEVTGNLGTVDRTIIVCLTKDCTGENKVKEKAKKTYEFVNGRWQIPDPEPSERALKAANYAYEDSSNDERNKLLKNFSYGSNNSSFAIRNWAVFLDKSLEELVRIETLIEKSKAERSRPIYNYNEQPAQVIPQQNSINCTSMMIGDFVHTNCN
ncbi:hypothetical protein HZA75_03215 [Candidatus Roizmanbacteria bacterium]|nr:hypothetical protein [Candidatus Roizmanbacteria bacterium]